MAKLIQEAFRLQTLAGLRPVNEVGERDTSNYCYGTFEGMGEWLDADGKRSNVNEQDLIEKGYKLLTFESFKALFNSRFAQKNKGKIYWDILHPDGEKYFNAYYQKYGPFKVYVQDSILETDQCWDQEDGVVMVGASAEESGEMDFTHGEDHEGSMAHSEIKSLISNASRLEQLLKGNPELPGWVSAYITLASDYMNSVADYMVDQADTNSYDY